MAQLIKERGMLHLKRACFALWLGEILHLKLTWDQAQFSFRFVNNIPAGKAKGKEILALFNFSAGS